MSYAIESIAKSIGARRMGKHKATIDWLLTDSRSLSFPEETLFFALTTKRNSGVRYIPELYDRGVRNFVITEEDFKLIENGELKMEKSGQDDAQPILNSQLSTLNFLIVPNPLKALQKLAEAHRDKFKIPVIGITGSNGKTIVKEWLHQLLSPDRCIVRSPRSYNSQIGVPLSVWQLSEEAELGIFEAASPKWERWELETNDKAYHWYSDQYRRCPSGKFLLIAREMHGETDAFQRLRCSDLQRR